VLGRLALLLAAIFAPSLAWAQADAFSPQSLSGYLDLRASDVGGERSQQDGGLGKLRYGDGARLAIGEAAVAWRPSLVWDWSAVVEGEIQPDHDRGLRLGEAYLRYKPLPVAQVHYAARVGLFYPPISEEHVGPFWTPADTITPSAINSWVGEEIKVAGLEGSARRDFGDQSLGITLAVFGDNETSGTLLATHGWSLGDLKTNATGFFRLPPLSPFLQDRQATVTNPMSQFDHRVGYYGRIDLRLNGALSLNAVYYDDPSDLRAEYDEQWGWDTRFLNVGARYDLDERTWILSQVLVGDTVMGPHPDDRWVNTGFTSAYLLVTHLIGENAVTARADVFSTADRADPDYGATQEHGWSLTADYRRTFTAHVTGLIEVLHVESDRLARAALLTEAPFQTQTALQAALRLSF